MLRPRLADAQFFYHMDQKCQLDDWTQQLKHLVFIRGLGSVYDKTQRIKRLALHIAEQMVSSVSDAMSIDLASVGRASELAKSDLLTTMVQEFPDLQGIMGKYYAGLQGESDVVALAIQEHYLPRFAGDQLPVSVEGLVLAIADRIDSLVGLSILNKMPTGDKDPFALRRGAIGILRMIMAKQLNLDLSALFHFALALYQDVSVTQSVKSAQRASDQLIVARLINFFYQRLKAYYKEQKKTRAMDVFAALQSDLAAQPLDFAERIQALQDFIKQPEAIDLVAATKRIHNILAKQNKHVDVTKSAFNISLASEDAEINLYQYVVSIDKELTGLLQQPETHYREVVSGLVSMAPHINNFFDQVMVMVEDIQIRNNRLALLARVSGVLAYLADFSKLNV